MTIEEMKQHKRKCEYGILSLVNEFTAATGCRVDSVYCNDVDVTTICSKDKDIIYTVSISVGL